MSRSPKTRRVNNLKDYGNYPQTRSKYYKKNKKHLLNKHKQWRLNNPEKCKLQDKRRALRKFNLTIEKYNNLIKKQNNVCAICHQKETMKNQYGVIPLSVDHNHRTNRVRGLLCSNCNNGLGRFKDKIDILKRAIKYLRKDK